MTDAELASVLAEIRRILGERRANGVRKLLIDLDQLGVQNLTTYKGKLKRALKDTRQLQAVIREGVYARRFSQEGAVCAIEPRGSKGPDLSLTAGCPETFIELKRVLDGHPGVSVTAVEDWHQDEMDPSYEPTGEDRLTDKLLGIVRDAVKQLVPSAPNVIVLANFGEATMGNFRRLTRALEEEIANNGTYGRITAIQFDGNFFTGGLGQIRLPTSLWRNSGADVELPEAIAGVLEAAVIGRALALHERMQVDW